MSFVKAKTMPGVMELLPLEQVAFQRMLGVIRSGFERFGFLPIETPVLEYVDVLLQKTGGDTERQVYFAQSTGSRQQGRDPELAMRFDLTVPLARYVAEHERKLTFPFRRYQIQRVYRGESAQKGRFREFYQCDIDVIGKDQLSLQYDAEIPTVIYHVFTELGVGPFTINLNNRKLMMGFFAEMGIIEKDEQTRVLREVDKLDKRGRGRVVETLTGEGFELQKQTVEKIMDFVDMKAESNAACLQALKDMGIQDPSFMEGLAELETVIKALDAGGVPEKFATINLSIARGLDYYTGTVYETILDDHPNIGSVCSGGRYENLAGFYTKTHLPGVGISIGATRLFYQLMEAGLATAQESTIQVLVTRMDPTLMSDYLGLASKLRKGGLNTEVFHRDQKLGKQLKYVTNQGIRFAIIRGQDEAERGTVVVRDLANSEQFEVTEDEMVKAIRERLQQPNG